MAAGSGCHHGSMADDQLPAAGRPLPSLNLLPLDEIFLSQEPRSTELLLVRHGQQVVNTDPDRPVGAFRDPPLSETGRRQAATVADALAGQPIAAVYSSHLQRARDTGQAIAEHHNLEVIQVPGLEEIGIYRDLPEGKRPNEVIPELAILGSTHRFKRDRRWEAFPMSETGAELRRRVWCPWSRGSRQHTKENGWWWPVTAASSTPTWDGCCASRRTCGFGPPTRRSAGYAPRMFAGRCTRSTRPTTCRRSMPPSSLSELSDPGLPLGADVAVVGAGPAGAAAAITLTRLGRRVVLIDKAQIPPRQVLRGRSHHRRAAPPRPPRSATRRRGVVAADRRGRRAGSRRTEATFALPSGGVYAAAAQRYDLDAALVAMAVAAGVEIIEGCAVTGVAASGRRRTPRHRPRTGAGPLRDRR